MVTFLVFFRGSDVGSAKRVFVCADPIIVKRVAEIILDGEGLDLLAPTPEGDVVIEAEKDGKRKVLQIIAEESKET